jgi:acetylglutamate kinase
LITAKPVNADLGFTGEPTGTDVLLIETLAGSDAGFIPVISPISADKEGRGYNINADTAAGVIASALGASRLMLLTDIEGVMDKDKNLLTDLSADEARELIADETAKAGMIPKLATAIHAVENDVEAVVILDGRRAHGLLVELFTDMGAGTLIR